MSWFTNMVTGKDNQTHDLGRWSWIMSWVAVITAAVGNWWHAMALDLMQLAQALSVVAAAHGAALWAKRDTEPNADHS